MSFPVLLFLLVLPVFSKTVRHRRRDLLSALLVQVELVNYTLKVRSSSSL